MRKILITGGPSTGKTILVNELKKLGFNCFKEISREITKEWKKKGIDQFFLTDPIAFSKILYKGRGKALINTFISLSKSYFPIIDKKYL